MKKQKKKSLQIVKRIVTLFLILAITSTQIEPSVFAASSDGQWASESLKEDAVTENESADATADSTGTSNTDEDHTEESETEKKPETTENPAQNPGNAGTTDGSTQDPGNTGTTDGSTQNPGNAGTTDGSTQDPGNTGTTDGSTQDPDNTDNTDKTEQDPDNTDNTDKTAQDPETVVTEEQPTEEPDENLSAADAVLPVEISYYLPKFQELKIEAPEEYTDTEQQEEARAAVTDQAMADETTQKLLEQAEKDAESADADESALDTQALTESAVSEEEYVSYTQMAVTGDTLAAPEVSLPDDVQLDPEADPEDTDPLIGWQVAKLAGIVLSYADGTKINEGDVIPADQINEVSATAADDGIALMSISSTTLAKLVALTQDMTVVQRVGAVGANGKWSILVQGGTVQSDTAGTVRHAYGTIAEALNAINKDKESSSFKITLLDDYTADSTDINALGVRDVTTSSVVSRTDKPTIVFTGAVNYATSTSYQSWNTLTFPNSSSVYFSGYNPYFTHINIDGSGLSIYGNQNDTSFVDMKFVSGVNYLHGGRWGANTATVDYVLTLDQITTTADAPIKNLYAGSYDSATGNITLNITNSEIYGNVYASGRASRYTQTGNVTANLKNVAIYRYYNANKNDSGTADTDKDMLNSITSTGGAFWGAEGKVTGNVQANFTGSYYAQYGTWYGNSASIVSGTCTLSFDITNDELNYVGTYNAKVSAGFSYINVKNTTVMNVFGWDYLDLKNCSVAPETHFGRMQYDSSFKKYWENKGSIEAENGASEYTPDITSYNGNTWLYSTTVYSTGTHYKAAWNRQRYGVMYIWDGQNVFNVSGVNEDGGNLLYAKYVYGMSGNKAKLICAGIQSSAHPLKYIKCASQSNATTSVKYITPVTLAGESTYAITASGGYVNAYYTGSSTSDYRIKLLNSSGKVVTSNSKIGPLIDYLKTVTASGSYTISVESPYTLNDDDLKEFNTMSTNLANKDVTISGVGTFIAGGEHYQYDDKGNRTGKEEVAKSFRFSRLYPQFKSLKWSNVIFRGDFKDKNGAYTTDYYIHGNGHSLSFENCKFTGPVTIDAGGASGYSTGTSGSTVSLKNCKYVKNVYANNSNNASLGITTLMIDSCTGYEDAPVNIDVARVGTVSGLTVNVNNCKAKIASYYTNTAKITGGYSLNVRDSKVSFVNPLVTTSNIATVALNGDVTLTDTCKGIPSIYGGKSYLRIYGNVKTSSEKNVYLQDFDGITIDGGQLKLGDSANKIEGGLYYSDRRAAVSLENSGKLIFAYMPSNQNYRWIDSLKSDATNTELSVAYATTGYPLYVSNALTLPSSSQLRVSTSLMPTHTGTTEYPLIQFAASTNAKLNQYTWIADQRYYLAKGSNERQIVLRADTYAPMVYQAYTSTTSMTRDSSGNQTGIINLYIRDYARNAIDTTGTSINKASDGKYPKGLQVYLSTQDVQLKDGVYGYAYNSSTDTRLTSYSRLTSGSVTDVNSISISATTDSPILKVQIPSRTYTVGVNYFIYVRDVAGNWSKFLLDTNGPTINYTNVTSTGNSDGSFDYTFSGLQFADAAKTVSYGTSDITALNNYTANATKYINDAKRIKEIKWNKTGVDPWTTTTGSTTVPPTSTGTCTLSNVNLKAKEKLYVFAMDGYGNKSKFEFVPITFDVSSNGATTDGRIPNHGSQYFSTLGLVGSTLKSEQLPSNPTLKDLAFRYWYKSTDSTKSNAYLTTMKVTEAATYYPLWNYPTLTISNTVTGSAGDKTKPFTYTVQVESKSGSIYRGTEFSYTGSSISGVTAPSGGTFTSNPTAGDLTFGLKHGQSITITLKDYYDSVYVVQTKESEYWTSYTTEGNVKYNSTATKQVAVDAVNRRFEFTNSNDKSQPVVYQSKIKEGTWSESEGNSYKRGINLYIRDLYGCEVDMTGESFTTEEKSIYPSNVGRIGHIYLSPQDAKLVNGKYDYVYDKKTDYLLNDVGSGIWEASTQTDINGNTIPAKTGYPILKYSFDSGKNIAFDQDTNYFIYVRDKTGTWTKFLLDTKGPVVKEQGTVTFTKSGSNYVYSIKNLKFEDEQIRPANGTSALSNAADEKFSYDANATTYNTAINSEVRYNTTGYDPFVSTASASQYKKATKNGDGTYTISNVSLTAGQKLYVFSQDAYGNVSAVQYVPVTFDATEGGAHKKTAFVDKTPIKSTLVRKGGKLIADQIPQDPHFTVDTTQEFLNWYDSTDTTDKAEVNLANYVANAGVTFYANYEMPGITITQKVTGDAANRNQEFEYTVQLLDANGNQLDDNTEILCVGSVIEGSGATSPDIKSLTVTGEYGEVTFKLKHGQVLKLLPGALKYNVGYIKQTDSAGYTCAYRVVGQEAVASTEAYDISIDEIDGQVDFVNTKDIVVTGISDGLNSKTLPIVGLAAVVVMLGASTLMLKRRRRS